MLIVWCSDMGKVIFVLLFCLFCFLSLSVSCCVLVGVCFLFFLFLGGRGLGWVVLFKIPWSIYLMLFRLTNLSALLLPYFTVMLFFLLLHGSGNQLVFLFFFPYFSAGLSGNDVHSLASSFILAFSHFPALFFIQHKYLLVPAAMASQHLLCHLYKALLYVHDIELVEIGVWWTMSVCFFPPHQT